MYRSFLSELHPASRRAYTRGITTRTAAIDPLLLNRTLLLASPIFLPSQPTHCRSPGLDRSQAPIFGHPRLVLSMCTTEIELGGKRLDDVRSDTQMETRRSHSSTSMVMVRIRSTAEALQYLIDDYRVE